MCWEKQKSKSIHPPLYTQKRNPGLLTLEMQRYFDSLDDLPKSELKLCTSTEFMNRELIGKYVEWTGDTEGRASRSQAFLMLVGVELQATGGYAAKCFDGYWWAGPACRSDTSKCLGTPEINWFPCGWQPW